MSLLVGKASLPTSIGRLTLKDRFAQGSRSVSHIVDLFIFPDCQLLDASGPWQVFASANTLLGRTHYELRLNAINPGEVRTNSGMALLATHPLATTPSGDTLLVAGGHGVHELDDEAIVALAARADSTPVSAPSAPAPLRWPAPACSMAAA